MSRSAARFTQAELARAARVDGRVAANKRRAVVKRIDPEKGAAIRATLPPELAAESVKADTFVYFAKVGFRVKIGFSKDPRKRLNSMMTSFSERPEILYSVRGGRALERHFHDRFAVERLNGEWFRLSPNLRNFLEGLPPLEDGGAFAL